MSSYWKRTLRALGALLAALPIAAVASAQARDEYGDASDPGPSEVAQTVARISHIEGSVSYARGDQPDAWEAADLNVPMTLGDRVYTDRRSRVELQVHGGDVIWLGGRTDLAVLNLTDDTKQFALKSGVGTFHVRRLDDNDVWEVDTPNAAVTFERPGNYRVDVDADGNTRVSVQQGDATVAAGGGQITLNSGEAMAIQGIDSPRYDVLSVSSADQWDRWVQVRNGRFSHSTSARYVSADIVGVDDLDAYGSWQTVPEYGNVWSPTRVDSNWAPYREGHWGWQDPWGWTWISSEAWGWAPYHYGRWVNSSSRWFWVPVAPSVRVVSYAPALVAFVGGGPDFSASVTIGGGGYVGWFPLGPRDPVVEWWSPRRSVNVNVTNVTYVNRTYVTVVNQNTFISSGSVARNVVTDRNVVRQVAAAPVIRGTAPVLPTVASIRFSQRTQASAPRPPAAIVARPVVARVAPPPAPPNFQQKLAVIRENRGAPVSTVAATRIATQSEAQGGQPRSVAPVRPAVSDSGRVTLAPSTRASSGAAPSRAPAVAPVGPVRGRATATTERPVAAGPVNGRAQAQSVPPASSPERSAAPGAPVAGRPEAPEQRPMARPTVMERPETAPAPAPANRPADIRDRPAFTPQPREERMMRPTAVESPRTEAAPENRAPVNRQQVPVPPDRSDRVFRPTPPSEQPGNPNPGGEGRVRPDRGAAPTPDWRNRARPTARDERPSREAAPQTDRARPAGQAAPAQNDRERGRPGVVTPPPSREVVRPGGRQPQARPTDTRSTSPKPRPTPES